MIEEIILFFINALKSSVNELERAFYETFGDRQLARQFNAEAEKRCEINKTLFIRSAAVYIGRKVLDEHNFILPPEIAVEMAKIMFYSAKQEGMIDILNNAKM